MAETELTIKIRWRDMDAYGHVNNGVYLNYLEECRDRLIGSLMGADNAWDFVLARVGIDFRNELTQDDGEITVRCAVAGFGRSSVRTRETILKADGTVAAEAESVIVPRDRERGGSRPLTDAERAILGAEIEAGSGG
jgi:acyl-CoA thioester hydrolase